MDDVFSNEFILFDRLEKIKSTINQYGEDQFYVSFSGGKDSTVLHHLIDEALPGNKIPRVYINTGIEYVEMVKFVRKLAKDDSRFEIISPQVSTKKVVEEYGYPFKSKEHANYCFRYRRGVERGDSLDDMKSIKFYINEKKYNGLPKKLKYQFTPEFALNGPFRISDKCCLKMKEEPLDKYGKEHKKAWTIVGLMREEGGRRQRALCLSFRGNRPNAFQPLVPVSTAWENWYIKEREIELCPLYYPPYNLERTGCKCCPFGLGLQEELNVLSKHFPEERNQAEWLWQPVYEEYRKLDYRLSRKQATYDKLICLKCLKRKYYDGVLGVTCSKGHYPADGKCQWYQEG